VNLSNLPNLQVFALYAIIKCGTRPSVVLHDINIVLGAIPTSNKVTNLWFDVEIIGHRPFHGCLDQDWVGLFDEIIRISDGKPLELELQMIVSTGKFDIEHPGRDELFMHIMERAALLSDYPKICTHFWNPTFWDRGLGPFSRGEVRSRCRG
jgi:hypothetical protein